jgi:hypothetical protein
MAKRLFGRLALLTALLCALTVLAPATPARRIDCPDEETCQACKCRCQNARSACLASGTHWTVCHADFLFCTEEICSGYCSEGAK